ncbi:MAG: hypothetical protein DRR19_20395 [Candidatus Parabeggiatoa sp. nov. 1]|nr:MAG: hypothetical protein DRR19_20395 [Gammaproteobacteria bacterium]
MNCELKNRFLDVRKRERSRISAFALKFQGGGCFYSAFKKIFKYPGALPLAIIIRTEGAWKWWLLLFRIFFLHNFHHPRLSPLKGGNLGGGSIWSFVDI